jgi:hypothetical protein
MRMSGFYTGTKMKSDKRDIQFTSGNILASGTRKNNITCIRDYRQGFGLDDWIYCALYIRTVRGYRQLQRYRSSTHFQFTVKHALGFSAFASHIQVAELSQPLCYFKST